MNNTIILNFLKANLGKDFNDNFNELGCAMCVNNISKACLGYDIGGGASTAQMRAEIVNNPNWIEVSKNEARAGDLILSATGTGNGAIAHGHVGFLGENGIIYSNNSAKDCLDSHWTAQAWKNYYALKGGFEVKYYRAVGKCLVDNIKTIPKVLQSSQDSSKVSLTVKGIASFIVLISAKYGLQLNEVDINTISEQIILATPIITIIWGIMRKYI